MRDVAPTLAGLLGLKLPEAEGRDPCAGQADPGRAASE